MQTDVQTAVDPASPATPASNESATLSATAPGQLRVIKRNGAVVSYDESKISVAITKAYLAVEGGNAAASSRIHESVQQLGRQITDIFRRRMPSGGTIHIEDIQDQVELALMRTGEHKIARSYVIYRADHARIREQKIEEQKPDLNAINVTLDNGDQGPLDTQRLQVVIREACEGLEDVSADDIYQETLKNLYPGVKDGRRAHFLGDDRSHHGGERSKLFLCYRQTAYGHHPCRGAWLSRHCRSRDSVRDALSLCGNT